jgi:hypothetical protein
MHDVGERLDALEIGWMLNERKLGGKDAKKTFSRALSQRCKNSSSLALTPLFILPPLSKPPPIARRGKFPAQ